MDKAELGNWVAALTRGLADAAAPSDIGAVTSAAADRTFAQFRAYTVDRAAFFEHMGRVAADEADPAEALTQLCVEDLFLAHACAQHDEAAIRFFQQTYEGELRAALGKMRVAQDRHDDVRQRIWQKLFVGGENRRPRILEYSGRADLRHWFRVTVVRTLLDDLRRQKRDPEPLSDDEVLGIPTPERDPELQHLRELYSHEFRQAFSEAVTRLTPEERNVLRCYYAESMTVDQIAVSFGVHRATAARRVNRARDALIQATREQLAARLKLSGQQLDSVLELIESNLHVSVMRLLA